MEGLLIENTKTVYSTYRVTLSITEIPIKKYSAIYIAVGVVNKNMEVLSQICVRGKKVYCHMIFD